MVCRRLCWEAWTCLSSLWVVVCAGWVPLGSTVRARPVASLAIEKACSCLIPGEEQILQRNLISGLVCCCWNRRFTERSVRKLHSLAKDSVLPPSPRQTLKWTSHRRVDSQDRGWNWQTNLTTWPWIVSVHFSSAKNGLYVLVSEGCETLILVSLERSRHFRAE